MTTQTTPLVVPDHGILSRTPRRNLTCGYGFQRIGGTRTVQMTHVARLKFPAPTMETWVTDSRGEVVEGYRAAC